MNRTHMNLAAKIGICWTLLFALAAPVPAQTWKPVGKAAVIPVVVANAACNSSTDTLGVTADRTKLLTCQSGVWKASGGSGTWVDSWIWIGTSGTIDTNQWVPGAKQVQITAYGGIDYTCCGGTAAAYIDGRPVTQFGHFDINGGSEYLAGMWGNKTIAPGVHTISGLGFYISGYAM